MKFKNEREKIVEVGKKLESESLTVGTGGNISYYFKEEDLMAITPSGIGYSQIKPEDIAIMNMEGEKVDGDKKPSSELLMHLEIYKKREDIKSVIHTHSLYSTTISCLNEEIPSIQYMIAVAGGDKIPTADYERYGTRALAEAVVESMGEKYSATLMNNHGLIAGGSGLWDTYKIIETVEFIAELYYRSNSIGEPQVLDGEKMKNVHDAFENYGQQ